MSTTHYKASNGIVIVAQLPACQGVTAVGNQEPCNQPARYDYKTKRGPWANGCDDHWRASRMYTDLGTGMAQLLILKEDFTKDRKPVVDPNSVPATTHNYWKATVTFSFDLNEYCDLKPEDGSEFEQAAGLAVAMINGEADIPPTIVSVEPLT